MDKALFWIQVVATAFIAFTFVVYFFQLLAMRRASAAQNILSLITYLQEPSVREARRVVLVELKDKSFTEWTASDKSAASLVHSTYDVAGILIKSQLVPKEVFTENWGGSIVDCHAVLAPYIAALRNETSVLASTGRGPGCSCDVRACGLTVGQFGAIGGAMERVGARGECDEAQ